MSNNSSNTCIIINKSIASLNEGYKLIIRGDIHKSVNSTIMPKLVYVYEVVDAEDDRRKLVNCIYLGGVYEGPEGTKEL